MSCYSAYNTNGKNMAIVKKKSSKVSDKGTPILNLLPITIAY